MYPSSRPFALIRVGWLCGLAGMVLVATRRAHRVIWRLLAILVFLDLGAVWQLRLVVANSPVSPTHRLDSSLQPYARGCMRFAT